MVQPSAWTAIHTGSEAVDQPPPEPLACPLRARWAGQTGGLTVTDGSIKMRVDLRWNWSEVAVALIPKLIVPCPWLSRAAHASCDATVIAMRAAAPRLRDAGSDVLHADRRLCRRARSRARDHGGRVKEQPDKFTA